MMISTPSSEHRVLFFGQKPIGEQCFAILIQQKDISLVGACSNVSSDNWWKTRKIADYCSDKGVPFIGNESNDTWALLDFIQKNGVNTIISVQHNWILKQEVIDSVNGSAFNLHLASLPEFRGHNMFSHAILRRASIYGVTLHWMAPKVDTGSIAYHESFRVDDSSTAESLYTRSLDIGLDLFRRLMADLAERRTPPRQAMVGPENYFRRDSLRNLQQIIDPTDLDEVQLKARAFHFPPFEGAYMIINDRKFYVSPAWSPLVSDAVGTSVEPAPASLVVGGSDPD